MKVIFSDNTYSYLFSGGKNVHAIKLNNHLKNIGIEIDYENWWDPNLKGDVVHFLGFDNVERIRTLKKRGYKIVYTHIMDGVTNLPHTTILYHKYKNVILRKLPKKFDCLFPWRGLIYIDAFVYMNEFDKKTAIDIYNIPIVKTHVIPHAVDDLSVYLGPSTSDDKHLVSVGTITPRKQTNLTAKICSDLGIKVKFIGQPHSIDDDYYKEFRSIIDKSESLEYVGFVDEKTKVGMLKNASGFILLSKAESGCIAVYEAAAAGLPLFLSDLPWAKGYESLDNIKHGNLNDECVLSEQISQFFESSERQDKPVFKVKTWFEVASMYKTVYESIT
jgi:glycosyltransferase involved in cell wall biosynthesis